MEDIERQLAAATGARGGASRGAPAAPDARADAPAAPDAPAAHARARTPGGGLVIQRDVTAPPLTREVEPRSFAECAYEPPRRGANDEEQMAGAARWEMLGTDEVRACVLKLCADDMGALVCTHRAFAAPVEEAARYLLSKTREAPAPRRCRISNAFCEPAWRAFKACARYHRLDARSTVAAGGAHSLLLGDGDSTTASDVAAAARPAAELSCGPSGRCERDAADEAGAGPARRQRRGGRAPPLCVCDDGSLWAWGKAADHQLGTRVDDVMAPAPARVRLEGTCGRGRRGGRRALARRRRGRGPLELGPQRARPAGPRHGAAVAGAAARAALRARPVVQAAAGAFHSLAVLREGALYAFGLGADGRLGLGHQLNATLPEMVPLHQFVRQAAAGATHSACCDSAGCLYTWGDGAKGALGHLGPRPRKNKNDTGLASMPSWESALRLGEALQHSAGAAPAAELTPRPVAALRHVRVVQVQCNERETVALDGDGVVYVVGQASAQAAGASPTLPRKTPETSPLAGIGRARAPSFGGGGPKPAASSKQKSAVVAHRFHAPVLEVASSARHVVVRTTEDTYFAWGGGDGGAGLGVGDAKGRARPTMLPPWN